MKANPDTDASGERLLSGGVWRFLPPGAAEVAPGLAALADWLSPGELLHYQALKVPKRALEFAASRLAAKQLARAACELAAGREFAQIEVNKEESGAPYLKFLPERQELRGFSLSHSHGAVLCALRDGHSPEFGVDLEWIEPRPDSFQQDFFTDRELAAVSLQPLALRPLAATLIWSAKEAVLKALRIGLGLDTLQIEVALPDRLEEKPGQWSLLSASNPQEQRWQVGWQVRAGFVLTLAQPDPSPFHWQEIV